MSVTRRLERREAGSITICEYRLDGRTLRITTGVRPALATKSKLFLTAARAAAAVEDLVRERQAEGYRLADEVAPSPLAGLPRDAALEAALRVDRDDPAPYAVYADWLQQHGNPYGELMAFARDAARESVTAPSHQRMLRAIDALALPSEDFVTVEWRHGMWRSLKFDNPYGYECRWMDVASRMFGEIACAALAKLSIGSLSHDADFVYTPWVIECAIDRRWARELASLHVGDVDPQIDMAHHTVGAVGVPITRAFPGLRELIVHSGDHGRHRDRDESTPTMSLAGLALPHLERFVVETCSMSREHVADLLAGDLPSVIELELWFGSTAYGATARTEHLRPLLDGERFQRVTQLHLRNAEFTDELAALLGATAIAPRLELLDLSMGTLSDAGALALAQSARAFRRLQRLDVDDNALTATGLAALRDAFSGPGDVISTHQKTGRYVTVGE